GAARVRNQSDARERLDEFRFQAGDNDVASECNVATGTGSNTIHGRNDRKGEAAQAADEGIVGRFLGATEHDGLTWLGKSIAQILACTEAAARTGYQQGPAAFIGFSVVYRFPQSEMHRLVEGVELVGPVQGDDPIAGALINKDRTVGG